MMPSGFEVTRRSALKAAAAAGAVLLSGSLASGEMALGVRKNAKDLTENEWQALERGVAAMKGMPKATAVSWWFQANIHGYLPEEPPPIYQGWATCQHGNWWFLPWHRAYLLYFEKILRRYSGDSTLMLPYWDWTDPNQQALPARFLDPSSPLYENKRKDIINTGGTIDPGSVSWPTAARQILFSTPTGQGIGGERVAAPGDKGTGGALETHCHNLVHDDIGGLMGDPDTAAQDPIFWLHHANVDRLWSAWLRARGGAYLPSESLWRDTAFYFYGPMGNGGYASAAQLLNTENLGYRYADYPGMPTMAFTTTPQNAAPPAVIAAAPQRKTTIATQVPPRKELTSEPLSVTFAPNAEQKKRVEGALRPMAQTPGPGGAPPLPQGQSFQVVIDDIRFDRSPGRFYEVYVNLPDPADAKGPESLYYGGSISFFALSTHHGRDGHAMGGGKTATIDVTEALSRLRAAGKPVDVIKVTLIERSAKPKPGIVGAPAAPPAPKVTIGTIRLQHSEN